MRLFLVPLIILVVVNAAIDYYIFLNLSHRLRKKPIWKWIQAITATIFLAIAIIAMSLPMKSGNDSTLLAINWLLFIYISVYIPKYIYIIFDLISKLPLLFQRQRWKFLSRSGAVIAFIIFFAFWWGALINRYNIDVKRITVEIPDLPEKFDGFTLLQFSDFHVGTYGQDVSFVSEVVDKINELNPDAVVFTGDIVNRHSPELSPFVDELARINVGDSVRAILGNHDYGDYHQWKSLSEKEANMQQLYSMFDQMGWKLLRNQTDWLVKGNDSIALIGVENIGDPPFPVYGSLKEAYPNLDDDKVKILLSHNPAHWVESIKDKAAKKVALTLSGHTHAMQVTIGKWSPAKWRYPTWGGLYNDVAGEHQLYVNIGVGTVGMPMRIGATPELTLITLTKGEK